MVLIGCVGFLYTLQPRLLPCYDCLPPHPCLQPCRNRCRKTKRCLQTHVATEFWGVFDTKMPTSSVGKRYKFAKPQKYGSSVYQGWRGWNDFCTDKVATEFSGPYDPRCFCRRLWRYSAGGHTSSESMNCASPQYRLNKTMRRLSPQGGK